MSFRVTEFDGVVITKEWIQGLDGQSYNQFLGSVSILNGEQMVGFKPGHTESNWVARIDGPTMSYNFPGCQVRGIIAFNEGRPEKMGNNVLVVK